MHTPVISPLARRSGRGFTLLEMLITIGIIVFLFSLIAMVAIRVREKARMSRVKGTIKKIHVCMEGYKAIWREYPAGAPLYPDTWPTGAMATIYKGVPLDTSLVMRGTGIGEEGSFTKDEFDPTGVFFVDPWGNQIRYRKLSADRILIWSYGPNKMDEIGIGQVFDPKTKAYIPGTGGGEQESQGDDISQVNVDY